MINLELGRREEPMPQLSSSSWSITGGRPAFSRRVLTKNWLWSRRTECGSNCCAYCPPDAARVACQEHKQVFEMAQDSWCLLLKDRSVERDEVEQTSGVEPFFVARFDASTFRQ